MNKQKSGAILKSLRENKGLSQQQVAELLNIERTTYVKYETGVINPSRKLTDLAKLYNVSVDYLLGNEQQTDSLNSQLLSNNAKVATLSGEILSIKDDKKIALTVEILNRIKSMSAEQLEKLNDFLQVIK